MTCISWNYRDLAVATINRELRALIQRFKPAIVFLMETRAKKDRVEKVRRRLRFHHCYCVEANGLSGGLALFWNDNYTVQILDSCPNYIHSVIEQQRTSKLFETTFIYGNLVFNQMQHLWNKIKRLSTGPRVPWVCMGDFNELFSQIEKEGSRPVELRRIELFREFLNST